MDKKSAIILGLLGAGPLSAIPLQASAIEQAAYSVHEDTAVVIKNLIGSNAIYANADATNLLIRRSALGRPELIADLEVSSEVTIDPQSGDFIIRPDFAVALLKSRAFDGMLPKTIQDFVLMQKLRCEASGSMSPELEAFSSQPFFRNQ